MTGQNFQASSVYCFIHAQLAPQGVNDTRVTDIFARIPRALFLREAQKHYAYTDAALPAPGGFLLPPARFARIVQAMPAVPENRMLFVGGDTGYEAAVLALTCGRIYVLERDKQLCSSANQRFFDLHINNARIIHTEEYGRGHVSEAPYNVIFVNSVYLPENAPQALTEQLCDNGLLVYFRAGNSAVAETVFVHKENGALRETVFSEEYLPERFPV